MFFNDVYLLLAFFLVLSILFAIYPYIKKRYSKSPTNIDESSEKSNENQITKIIDLVLNFLLRFTLIPLFVFAIFFLIPTVMMSDAGVNEDVYKSMLSFFLRCWSPPIIVSFVLIISSKLRKNNKISLSIVIQIITILMNCFILSSIFLN